MRALQHELRAAEEEARLQRRHAEHVQSALEVRRPSTVVCQLLGQRKLILGSSSAWRVLSMVRRSVRAFWALQLPLALCKSQNCPDWREVGRRVLDCVIGKGAIT